MTQVTSGGRLVNDVSGQAQRCCLGMRCRVLSSIRDWQLTAARLHLAAVLVLVAFLIKVDLRGPVLLSAEPRRTRHGRIFTILKSP